MSKKLTLKKAGPDPVSQPPREFRTLPITSLLPDEKNPRKDLQPGDPEYQKIKTSIEQFQFLDPIVFNSRTLKVLGGHQRLKILKDTGITDLFVLSLGAYSWAFSQADLQELPPAMETAANIALNKASGDWDNEKLVAALNGIKLDGLDISITGFGEKELVTFMAEINKGKDPQDAEPQISRAEELRKEWGTEPGQMWQCGPHRIVCGDCTDPEVVERVMQGEKAQTVFTSPPYAVGVDYASYSDTIENLREMLPKLAEQWYNMVVPGGFAVVNFGDIVSAQNILKTDEPCEYPMALEYWPVFRAAGWVLWSRRIWCKPGAGTSSMQCISSNCAATNWEHVWTWKAPGPAMFPKQTTGEYPSQNGWFDSSHSTGLDVKLKVHGAGMPLLPAMFSISNHSTPAGIVFEPFSGTGTTMIACENLGRTCRGVEIDPGYTAVCLQRYKDVTGKDPVLVTE